MILGRSILHWVVVILVAVLVFLLAMWLIPLVFGLLGIAIPSNIVTIIALLIAIGVVWGGYGWQRNTLP
jgi:hypothetical protein